jgi:hypothetical protein
MHKDELLKPWQVALSGINRRTIKRHNSSAPTGGTLVLDLKTRKFPIDLTSIYEDITKH